MDRWDAEKFRRLLKGRGISQRWVASELGVSEDAVSTWAQNIHEPTGENARRVAALLQVSLEDLMTGEVPSRPKGSPGPEPAPTANLEWVIGPPIELDQEERLAVVMLRAGGQCLGLARTEGEEVVVRSAAVGVRRWPKEEVLSVLPVVALRAPDRPALASEG